MGDSPLALLSMWGNFCSVVWSLPNSQFDEIMGLSDDAFLARLNETLQSPSIYERSVIQKYLHAGEKQQPPLVTA